MDEKEKRDTVVCNARFYCMRKRVTIFRTSQILDFKNVTTDPFFLLSFAFDFVFEKGSFSKSSSSAKAAAAASALEASAQVEAASTAGDGGERRGEKGNDDDDDDDDNNNNDDDEEDEGETMADF